jgi:hypothetical protein
LMVSCQRPYCIEKDEIKDEPKRTIK